MATCPSGHESASDDYCDVCGTLIGTAVLTPFVQAPGPAPDQAPGGVRPRRRRLPALRRPAGRPVLRVVRLRLQRRRHGRPPARDRLRAAPVPARASLRSHCGATAKPSCPH